MDDLEQAEHNTTEAQQHALRHSKAAMHNAAGLIREALRKLDNPDAAAKPLKNALALLDDGYEIAFSAL